eukprot:CCRYP_015501-RA/>CCRYP_015501-RA protein AED:0.03 eAED:0.03 QI:456/1/1/1/1/1/2/291/270
MTPPESKLKRSPYLSQIAQSTDMKMTAKLTHPVSGEGAKMVDDEGSGGAFFELKRPEVTLKCNQRSLGYQGQCQHQSFFEESHGLWMGNSPSSINSHLIVHLIEVKQTPLKRLELPHTENQSLFSVNGLDEACVLSRVFVHREYSQSKSTRSLQYYYNTGMKYTIKLPLDGRPARAMTFRDVLDEGDGKEGDLNVQRRNEQWKTLTDGKKGNCPRPLHHCRREHGERSFSSTDLAVLRQSACRRKMSWVTSTVRPGELNGWDSAVSSPSK